MEPRNFTRLEGRHSLAMWKATPLSATMRAGSGFGGVKIGPIMLHNDYQVNWGEPDVSQRSMADNNKTEEAKRTSGSRISK